MSEYKGIKCCKMLLNYVKYIIIYLTLYRFWNFYVAQGLKENRQLKTLF